MKILLLIICSFWGQNLLASPLKPVRLDSPRATMKSYVTAVEDYIAQKDKNKTEATNRLDDAARTMNLSSLPTMLQQEKGRQSALLLKEILDRVIIVDLEKVPDDSSLKRWRLKDTEITIRKVQTGKRDGDFLFDEDTVERLPEFYEKIKSYPYLNSRHQGAGYKEPLEVRWLPNWAQEDFFGLKKVQWLGIFLAIALGLLVKLITENIMSVLVRITEGKKDSLRFKISKAIEHPTGLMAASALWFSAVHLLKFEGVVLKLLVSVTQVIFSISLIWAAYKLTDILTDFFRKVADGTESELDDQLVPLLSKTMRIFVVVIGVLVTIQNLGVNVMSLLAGLGLGGLAFALAAKDTAANFFGSIMILLDRPFRIGDWIVTSQSEGTVEEIGFRSTRLRTFYDSLVTIPNSVMANEKIDNMGQRKYRRVRSILGLTYSTPPNKMEAFIEGVKNIIKANPHTRKDYFHVVFQGYGDFSLNIMLYFFLSVPNWTDELAEKQNVNLEILKLAKEIGVEFAFPTQSLFVESFPELPPKEL